MEKKKESYSSRKGVLSNSYSWSFNFSSSPQWDSHLTPDAASAFTPPVAAAVVSGRYSLKQPDSESHIANEMEIQTVVVVVVHFGESCMWCRSLTIFLYYYVGAL